MTSAENPIIVVGAGIAGLTAALRLAPRKVLLIANAPIGEGVASGWSQGGLAAALRADDSPELHRSDTIEAAAGIADPYPVQLIAEQAKEAVEFLAACGVEFDHAPNGDFALSKEAAHSRARIVRVKGDLTGPGIMAALRRQVAATPAITVRAGWQALDLALDNGRVAGLWISDADQNQMEFLPASAVILATGGAGFLYRNTSNPPTACGEGIAIAARAGAVLADLEFMQFHPTTLAVGLDPSPLATEALRGEGAVLINDLGQRFMLSVHKDAELAPRDIVARAIFRERQKGRQTFLDCREAIGDKFAEKFPKVFALCQAAGINAAKEPIPVEPAAHYYMGGIAVDEAARSSIPGLWVCGEAACTGAHGANRLASNSLLEAVVFAKRAAADIAVAATHSGTISPTPPGKLYPHNDRQKKMELQLREIMRDKVGLIRDGAGLREAIQSILTLRRQKDLSPRLSNMLTLAKMIALFALWREESRGSHFRADFPNRDDAWQKRQFFTLAQCEEFLAAQNFKAAI